MQSVSSQTELILTGIAYHGPRTAQVQGDRLCSVQPGCLDLVSIRELLSQASRTLLESSNPLAESLEGTRLDQMQGSEDHLESSLEGKGAEGDSTKSKEVNIWKEQGEWALGSIPGGRDGCTHAESITPVHPEMQKPRPRDLSTKS